MDSYLIEHLRGSMLKFLAREELYRAKAGERKVKVREITERRLTNERRQTFGDMETLLRKAVADDVFFKEYVSEEQFAGRLATMYAETLQAEVAYEQARSLRKANHLCT